MWKAIPPNAARRCMSCRKAVRVPVGSAPGRTTRACYTRPGTGRLVLGANVRGRCPMARAEDARRC